MLAQEDFEYFIELIDRFIDNKIQLNRSYYESEEQKLFKENKEVKQELAKALMNFTLHLDRKR